MSTTLRYASVAWILGAAAFGWSAGCSDTTMPGGGGNTADSGSPHPTTDGATPPSGDAGEAGDAGDAASGFKYTLIDDMETTTHGPIEYAGIVPPESPAYWFNFGPMVPKPADTFSPALTLFAFAKLTPATTTLMGKASAHAAYELCSLNGQYEVCGIGVEFAQVPELDAGPDAGCVVATDAASHDAGEGGPPICRVTVPFDVSAYKGITFWGKTAAGDAGTLDVKVAFPNTDTDPRGGVCNGGPAGAFGPTDLSQCFNSYAEHVTFTGDWQPFTILFSDLKIETFGYLTPGPWTGKNVYGINWQGQDNDPPDSGTLTMDLWIDDVYFIQ